MRLLDAFFHCSPAYVFPPGRENAEYPQASLRMDLTQSTGQMALCVISTFVKKRNIAVSAFHLYTGVPAPRAAAQFISKVPTAIQRRSRIVRANSVVPVSIL